MELGGFSLAEKFMLENVEDSVHDPEHIYRVLHMAAHIASTEPRADREVVLMAALLHDVGRPEETRNPGCSHSEIGARMAQEFLLGNGWKESFAARVAACIRTHSYDHQNPPDTIEAQIVFDADKLDLSGAMGVARAVLYGARIGEAMYLLDENGRPTQGVSEDAPSLWREYSDKLARLDRSFYTREARILGSKRQRTMDYYFRKLKAEVEETYELGAKQLEKWRLGKE